MAEVDGPQNFWANGRRFKCALFRSFCCFTFLCDAAEPPGAWAQHLPDLGPRTTTFCPESIWTLLPQSQRHNCAIWHWHPFHFVHFDLTKTRAILVETSSLTNSVLVLRERNWYYHDPARENLFIFQRSCRCELHQEWKLEKDTGWEEGERERERERERSSEREGEMKGFRETYESKRKKGKVWKLEKHLEREPWEETSWRASKEKKEEIVWARQKEEEEKCVRVWERETKMTLKVRGEGPRFVHSHLPFQKATTSKKNSSSSTSKEEKVQKASPHAQSTPSTPSTP